MHVAVDESVHEEHVVDRCHRGGGEPLAHGRRHRPRHVHVEVRHELHDQAARPAGVVAYAGHPDPGHHGEVLLEPAQVLRLPGEVELAEHRAAHVLHHLPHRDAAQHRQPGHHPGAVPHQREVEGHRRLDAGTAQLERHLGAVGHPAAVDAGHAAAGHRRRVDLRELRGGLAAVRLGERPPGLLGCHRVDPVLEHRQLVAERGRQHVAPGAEHLPGLDERRAEPHQQRGETAVQQPAGRRPVTSDRLDQRRRQHRQQVGGADRADPGRAGQQSARGRHGRQPFVMPGTSIARSCRVVKSQYQMRRPSQVMPVGLPATE